MINRNLENAQTGSGRFHLHLQIPAVSFFAHSQLRQRSAADPAERRHIAIANSVEREDQKTGEITGQNLLRVHTASLAFTTGARPNHEVMYPRDDRIDQSRNKLRHIAAVTVEKNDDVTSIGNR